MSGRRALFRATAALLVAPGAASASPDAPLSLAELAQLNFDPVGKGAIAEVPSNEEWAAEGLKDVVWLRIAVGAMTQTKDQLVSGFEKDPEMMTEVAEGIAASIKRLDGICNVLRGAEARLLVAGAGFAVSAGA